MRKPGNTLLGIAIIVMLFLILKHFRLLPGIGNWFRESPVTIDNTPLLIEQIRNLSQLVTITVYDEVVVDEVKKEKHDLNNPNAILPLSYTTTARIVLVGRGTVMAGINLDNLKESDCMVYKDSVRLHLPPAQILTTTINPSGFETFTEEGNWSAEEVTALKQRAHRKIEQRALDQRVLSMAATKSKQVIERFLRLAGFKKITITP
jgi:hypothetical protein